MFQEPKISLPSFYGMASMDDYLNSEMKFEWIFECHHVDHERRVVLAVEDGCCPFKIVFDEDFYVHFMYTFTLL